LTTASGTTASELAAGFEIGADAAKLALALVRLPTAIPTATLTLTRVLVKTRGRIRLPFES
jgi:hypothetical protein